MEENQIGLWGVIEMINKHGVEIKVGHVYDFVFGYPGPDITQLVVTGVKPGEKIKCFDPGFNFGLTVHCDQLRERKAFSVDEISRFAKYGKGYRYMVEQTLRNYEEKARDRVRKEVEVNFQMQVHLNRDAFTKLNSASRMLEESGHTWNAESEMWVKL
ncbi:hypothetical protein [Buttiauxella gaviniae]|uniref:hypothetical protein n=1 Tax=Buttiauxella gaviniae TaxID=82990 RepID=UPI0039756FF7